MKNAQRATVGQLAAALEEHRLQHRWSYDTLGSHVGIPGRTLHRFCTDPERGFHETTIYPIRQYLAGLTEQRLSA